MDYSSQLSQVKNLLPSAQSILIALPQNSNIDKLASGLSLYLSLTQAGKSLSIFCPDTIKVGQSHLFAIDKVSQSIPAAAGGDYSLTFKDVASNGVVPSLEKLDYTVSGSDLILVFKSLPGQTFTPQNIIPGNAGGSFNLVFSIGAASLNDFAGASISGSHLVNLDNNQTNTNFGQTNIVDPNAASISEMIVSILPSLGLPFDADMASNLIAGIFEETANLADKANAETFMAMANCLRVGGRKPQVSQIPSSGFDLSALMPPASPAGGPTPPTQPVSNPASQQPTEAFVNPTIINSTPTPSPEERPSFEQVVSESEAEPDWLTPKIFKGSSIG